MSIPQDVPVYRLLSSFFGPDDHLYSEGDIIQFDGIPNEEMEPLNNIARERLTMYVDVLEKEARTAAEKAGRHFTGRARTMEDAIELASADARKTQLVKGGVGVPLMGVDKTRNKAIKRLSEEDIIPETKAIKGRRGSLSVKSSEVALA